MGRRMTRYHAYWFLSAAWCLLADSAKRAGEDDGLHYWVYVLLAVVSAVAGVVQWARPASHQAKTRPTMQQIVRHTKQGWD